MPHIIKVNIWDVRTSKVEIVLHGPAISGEAIDFQDNLAVTGAHRSSNQVQLWDLREAKVLREYQWDDARVMDHQLRTMLDWFAAVSSPKYSLT